MSLEEIIRDCAKRGELVHLSLWFEPATNRWCATYSPSHLFGVSKAHHTDPVTAAVTALEGIKHARTRARNVINPAPANQGPESESESTEAGTTSAGEGDVGGTVLPST